jgi:mRNA-degrading endonuclease RelE of RelBE toxin-antitoxin system
VSGPKQLAYAARAIRDYAELSPARQAKFKKQIGFLLVDLRHPSLRAKKYDEARDIWQARVDDNFRFYFRIAGDLYEILSIIPHPK